MPRSFTSKSKAINVAGVSCGQLLDPALGGMNALQQRVEIERPLLRDNQLTIENKSTWRQREQAQP